MSHEHNFNGKRGAFQEKIESTYNETTSFSSQRVDGNLDRNKTE